MDLYWQIKTMMGKVLVERNEDYNEIMLQLDDMQLQIKDVDYKVSVLAQGMAGMDFTDQQETSQQVHDDVVVAPPL